MEVRGKGGGGRRNILKSFILSQRSCQSTIDRAYVTVRTFDPESNDLVSSPMDIPNGLEAHAFGSELPYSHAGSRVNQLHVDVSVVTQGKDGDSLRIVQLYIQILSFKS